MRTTGGIALGLTVLVAAGTAHAGTPSGEGAAEDARFETLTKDAVRVDRDGLAGVLWALTATCDQGDALARRQCTAVRAARAAKVTGKRLIVPADAAAFVVGTFDDKKSSLPLTVRGCVACVEPIVVDGRSLYVVSKNAAPSFEGAVARAGSIHETNRAFKNAEAAVQWRTTVVPRLRTELVIQIPAQPRWERDGKAGVAVDVLGFRVYDPCDGGIVCASPKADRAAVDHVACGDAVTEGAADADAAKKAARGPAEDLPDELGADAIKAAMAPVRDAAQACLDKYGVAGDGKLKVTVAADGTIVTLTQVGDFEGTPTGACIEKAAKAVTFPRTKKARQSFSYPIVLR